MWRVVHHKVIAMFGDNQYLTFFGFLNNTGDNVWIQNIFFIIGLVFAVHNDI